MTRDEKKMSDSVKNFLLSRISELEELVKSENNSSRKHFFLQTLLTNKKLLKDLESREKA